MTLGQRGPWAKREISPKNSPAFNVPKLVSRPSTIPRTRKPPSSQKNKALPGSPWVLTRRAVEAGEALGFLPGDLYEKITPYLRPLHDALQDMLPAEEIQKHMERNVIEIAPLAYMRGRTLNNAFIILDEAQNATTEQMFMFLTRMGLGSKAVIT